MISWWIYVTGKNRMYAGLHVKCPIFLSHFIQIWILSTDTHKSNQYQISGKSVQRKSRWCTRRDWEMNDLIPFHLKRTLLWRYHVASNNRQNSGLRAVSAFLLDSNQTYISSTDLHEVSHIKLHANPSNGRHADTCRRTDITTLIALLATMPTRLKKNLKDESA